MDFWVSDMGLVLMLCQLVNQWWCAVALSLLAVPSPAVIQQILFPLTTTIRTITMLFKHNVTLLVGEKLCRVM